MIKNKNEKELRSRFHTLYPVDIRLKEKSWKRGYEVIYTIVFMVFLKPAANVRKDQSSVPCEAVNSGVFLVCAVAEKFTSRGDENLSLNGPALSSLCGSLNNNEFMRNFPNDVYARVKCFFFFRDLVLDMKKNEDRVFRVLTVPQHTQQLACTGIT